MSDHTPGPWKVKHEQGDMPYVVSEQGKKWGNPVVCQFYEDVTPEDSVTFGPWLKANENAQANAEFVVRACNSHDALLEALDSLLSFAEFGDITGKGRTIWEVKQAARAAVNKAKGES